MERDTPPPSYEEGPIGAAYKHLRVRVAELENAHAERIRQLEAEHKEKVEQLRAKIEKMRARVDKAEKRADKAKRRAADSVCETYFGVVLGIIFVIACCALYAKLKELLGEENAKAAESIFELIADLLGPED